MGRQFIGTREAAERLGVTTTTTRTWIEQGDLAGFCTRAGRVFHYFAYEDSVRALGAARAALPQTVAARLRRLEQRVATVEDAAGSRVGLLEHVVRAQSATIDELRAAVRAEQEASELLLGALAARKSAAEALLRAEEAASAVAAALGVPDFPPA